MSTSVGIVIVFKNKVLLSRDLIRHLNGGQDCIDEYAASANCMPLKLSARVTHV